MATQQLTSTSFAVCASTAWAYVLSVSGEIAAIPYFDAPPSFVPEPPFPLPPALLGPVVPFTWQTLSGVTGSISAGATVTRVAVAITTPFDDITASLSFGLAGGDRSAFFSLVDPALNIDGQFDNEQLTFVPVADMLYFTLTPGASTQGAGILFYEFVP